MPPRISSNLLQFARGQWGGVIGVNPEGKLGLSGSLWGAVARREKRWGVVRYAENGKTEAGGRTSFKWESQIKTLPRV